MSTVTPARASKTAPSGAEASREDLVFPGEDGHHLRLARVHEDNMSWFAGAVKRSGIPRITPHDLRHFAASFAVSAGANVKAVQKMLGHSSAAMTLDVYADLFDGDLVSVSDALDHAVSQANVPKMCPPA
ncbi:integrase [Paenarthrobacter nitroguajacolicus]|uniref:tyrosine-type recombinase/integrase n=1 Tax=Paenarthrobacter nitroguajacolicus TaxID=211146 RepID=UPI00285EFCB8|nr:tyrosine-type recombinase/integrase [Paenarthrobacter nitroguajacolicus]MDR6986378.1 integrase [Paenarthrobacter nitroguajacolicus]